MDKSHQQYLFGHYQQLAQALLAGTITPEQFATQQALLQLELEKRAYCDGLLSQFFNRNGFIQATDKWIDLIRRLGIPGTLLALDIDNFKRFNDTFGHPEGDKLLKIYADVIEKKTRPSDLKGRLGGDELAVFLVGSDINNAKMIAESIRMDIIEAVKDAFPSIPWKQTVSIGIAKVEDSDNTESLRLRADQALYKAKQNRNCTEVFVAEEQLDKPQPTIVS